MKRLILISMAMTAMLLAACQPQAVEEAPQAATLKVVSGDLVFQPAGGTGTVTVEAEGTVTAESALPWCSASVSGKTITVTAQPYDGLESRYTPINIHCGDESIYIVAHQYGVILRSFAPEDIHLKNAAFETSFPYDANTRIKAESDADWLSFTFGDDALGIRVAENVQKEYREARVNWSIGDFHDSFVVSQFDAAEAGLLGTWDWHGYGGTRLTTDYAFTATLEETDKGYNLHLVRTGIDLNIPVVLDGKTVKIPLGAPSVGTYVNGTKTYYTYPLFAAGTNAVQYDAAVTEGYYPLVLEKDAETGKWKATGDPTFQEGLNFRFEFWLDETHTGASAQRLVQARCFMTQK